MLKAAVSRKTTRAAVPSTSLASLSPLRPESACNVHDTHFRNFYASYALEHIPPTCFLPSTIHINNRLRECRSSMLRLNRQLDERI